jgi:hypothetical protein
MGLEREESGRDNERKEKSYDSWYNFVATAMTSHYFDCGAGLIFDKQTQLHHLNLSQSSDSLIPPTPENDSSSPHLPPQTPPEICRSSMLALDLTPMPPRFRSTPDFEELPVVADAPSSQIKPQNPLSAAPTSPNQELYCSSPLAPLRDANYIRASVESVLDVDHQHGEDDYGNVDYQHGEVEYRDMDYGEDYYGDMGGEIDGVCRDVRGSKDSLRNEESSYDAELPDNQLTLPPINEVDLDIAPEEFEHEDKVGYSTVFKVSSSTIVRTNHIHSASFVRLNVNFGEMKFFTVEYCGQRLHLAYSSAAGVWREMANWSIDAPLATPSWLLIL